MKIEAGKYYRTRDGRKVGSMAYMPEGRHSEFPWVDPEGNAWKANGQFSLFDDGESVHDLIAEWTDEPAASKPSPFVTRRELVPGVYGRIVVNKAERRDEHGDLLVQLCNRSGVIHGCKDPDPALMTADELDEAAHLFAQLAEYLRETK